MRRRSVVIALVALLAAGVVGYLVLRESGPAGELGDELANALGCGGGTTITEKGKDDQPEGASAVYGITCSSGYVNPFVTLYRFENSRSLKAFLSATRTRLPLCVSGLEVFDDGIAGVPHFGEFCADHGGSVQRPRKPL
jgi:hypothetical protein